MRRAVRLLSISRW